MTQNPFSAYVSTLSEAEVNELILSNLPLVKHIIGRLEIHLPYGMDREDLVSVGNMGLIEAARQYDPSRNVKFQTYAYIRIRGAILDEIRKSSFGGQTVVRKHKQLSEAARALEQEFGRYPTEEELAGFMDISIEKVQGMLEETRAAHLISLDAFAEIDDVARMVDHLFEDDSALDEILEAERLALVAGGIDRLADQEKLVLSLYYEQELSLKEISLIMELTESRISQIHKKAILFLQVFCNR